ncbi:MAG TPA: alpha/beta fold hydrolase [Bradyrhizobium sp.]|uniref:alpha/beta hydrolase family protein n=1 Tax=Bradyrhizobium sp. TaxID=376 RepID=UPI002B52C5F7|nr:alpha/beta fold hydrolase [Bradyrhizobium sp.]HTB00807.1 alpha/beta fold hydrolase [Bradyrhizobium sp.]
MDRRTLLALAPLVTLFADEALAENTEPAAPAAAGASPLAKSPLFADDAQFWFETQRAFGAAEYGGSLFGEVLAAASRIAPGDYDSWYNAWNDSADRLAKEAADQLSRKHRVSARDTFLRATSYYQCSEFFLHGNPADPRIARAYRLSVDCYKHCAKLHDPLIEPVEIPYEKTTLPGYFHHAEKADGPRPTLIMHTGFDGSAEEMHVSGARAAIERGYNVLAFDGPGQYGPLHRDGLVFRPDWEKVVTPVVDFALQLPNVDPKRIALMGISMGGVLAPRAAAFDKRLAALIANDGIYDFAAAFRSSIPADKWDLFVTALNAEQAPRIDALLEGQMKASPTARWSYQHGMWATGAKSPRAFVAKMLDYNLKGGIAEQIACPTLVCDAENDLFLKGQPQELFDHLTCRKTMIRFTTAEGAGAHCQVGASRLAFARIFDWLDETLT